MRLGSGVTSRAAALLVILGIGCAAFAWACSDDPAPAEETAPDGGEAGIEIPNTPGGAHPLDCVTLAADDPCTAPRLPVAFIATQLDGGSLSDAEAAPLDAGAADAASPACLASGSITIQCQSGFVVEGEGGPPTVVDAGVVRFDIAGDGTGTQLAAWATGRTTRLVIDPEGEIAEPPPSLIDAVGEVRVFVRDGSPIVVAASGGSDNLSFFAPTAREDFPLGTKLDILQPLRGATLTSDGTLFTLVVTPSATARDTQLVTLPRTSKGKEATIAPAPGGLVLGSDRSNRPLLVDVTPSGLVVTRPTGTIETIKQEGAYPLAISSGNDDNPIVAAYDEVFASDLAVFAALGTDAHDYAAMRIVRGAHCKQSGCDYTCTEDNAVAVPNSAAAFVRDSFNDPLLVYLEATVSLERTYRTKSSPTKPCASDVALKTVKETAVVVMAIEKTPVLRLVERTRARVALDPKGPLFNGMQRPFPGILASVHGDTLHVGVPLGNNSMTRVLIDIAR